MIVNSHGPGSLAHEHTDLRQALHAAEEALADLESKGGEAWVPAPPQPRWGARQEEPSGPRKRTYLTATLRARWDAFCAALLEHMDHEELVLPSLVDRVETGHADSAEVMATLRPLFAEHERLHDLFGELRQACRSVEPVRGAMDEVVAGFLRHTEEEDTRAFPILFRHVGLETGEFPVLRRYTSDVALARGLRESMQSAERLEQEAAPSGFYRRITSLLRKKSR